MPEVLERPWGLGEWMIWGSFFVLEMRSRRVCSSWYRSFILDAEGTKQRLQKLKLSNYLTSA